MLGSLQKAVSPLMLCDRLITLAQQADHAGYRDSARRLLAAAHDVLDDNIAGQVS